MKIKIGILTVSDTCYEGKATDKSGPALVTLSTTQKLFSADVECKIVPDEQSIIENALKNWSEPPNSVDVVFTTGGTGFSPRDVTPEATRNVITQEAPGITIAMMIGGLDITPMAMLSRGIAGVRGSTLIINVPGSTKGAVEMATFALPCIPHAVSLLRNETQNIKAVHDKLQGCHTHHHHHCHGRNDDSSVDLTQVARRARESPYPMIEMNKAIEMVLQEVRVLTTSTTLPLKEALNHVTAQFVKANEDLPPFEASVKDGYAVITADGAGPRLVVGNSFAGNPLESVKLESGQCARVTTGAPIPPGADAVVQVEDTKLLREADDGKTELEIEILKAPSLGQDIRPIGSDMRKHQIVVEQRRVLNAHQIGLIAAAGVDQVNVYCMPKVAVLSTGDEVQDPGSTSRPGCIYDSNRPMLIALLEQNRFPVIDMGIIRDEPGMVLRKLKVALQVCDVVITSGGVSMGEKDYLKEVLVKDLGAYIHFGRVQMKPGKPTTFATCLYQGEKKVIFALPGNPVSAAVTSHLFVLPALKAMAGHLKPDAKFNITAKLESAVNLDPRPEYCRAILEWPTPPSTELPTAYLTGHQASSRLLSLHSATALLVLPPRTEGQLLLPAGSLVSAMLISQ